MLPAQFWAEKVMQERVVCAGVLRSAVMSGEVYVIEWVHGSLQLQVV